MFLRLLNLDCGLMIWKHSCVLSATNFETTLLIFWNDSDAILALFTLLLLACFCFWVQVLTTVSAELSKTQFWDQNFCFHRMVCDFAATGCGKFCQRQLNPLVENFVNTAAVTDENSKESFAYSDGVHHPFVTMFLYSWSRWVTRFAKSAHLTLQDTFQRSSSYEALPFADCVDL